jgi:RNA polymerase sigma factor (TIGR02999 family)
MRRILVESARRKGRVKHGGEHQRLEIEPGDLLSDHPSDDLLALDEALDHLAASDRQAAELVKLRYFAGLTIPQAAEALSISPRTADSLWSFARAWLRRKIEGSR